MKVYTDHKILTRDALGLTSDRVYRWGLLLEEYAPEIIYIKGIHNTVADAILQLEYDPKLNTTNEYTHAMLGVEPEELSVQRWKSFAHHLLEPSMTSTYVKYPYCKLHRSSMLVRALLRPPSTFWVKSETRLRPPKMYQYILGQK